MGVGIGGDFACKKNKKERGKITLTLSRLGTIVGVVRAKSPSLECWIASNAVFCCGGCPSEK